MTDTHANLTPPTKKTPPKAATTGNGGPVGAKEAKPAKDPNAPKKPRAARADYGFSPDSTIHIVKDKDNKYRGQRLDWFNKIVAFEGKKVSEFMTKYEKAQTSKGTADPPRGWVRFFVQDGTVTLSKPPATTAATPAAA